MENIEIKGDTEISLEKRKEIRDRLLSDIEKVSDGNNRIYFYVVDTKGTSSGTLSYIYDIAYTLKESGRNVVMLHSEKERYDNKEHDDVFVGVMGWLDTQDKQYSSLPHKSIGENDTNIFNFVDISPSDVVVIPELFVNVMELLKNKPCKKVVLLQNPNYVTELIPVSKEYIDYGITEIITNTKTNAEYIESLMSGGYNMHTIAPTVENVFKNENKLKNLVVNIVSKSESDLKHITKTFYWKYPSLQWITFNNLRGMSREDFAYSLDSSAITVWVDESTNFGYSALEAIKSGSIVIGKIPNNIPEWMLDENGDLVWGIYWVDNIRLIPDLLARVISAFMTETIPDKFYQEMGRLATLFDEESHKNNIFEVFNKIGENHVSELKLYNKIIDNELEVAEQEVENNKGEKNTK